MTLYAYFSLYLGQAKVDNFCENQFWAPKSEVVVELCEEEVWKLTYPASYE